MCLRGWRRPLRRPWRRLAPCAGLQPQFFERAFGDEPAVRDDADAVGHALGHFKNVRGHDDGAAGARALAQHGLDLARRAGVETGQRLVQNDHARLVHQRAGERHLLPHAFGKSFAAFVGMRRELEPIQKLRGARSGNRRLDAPQPGDEFQIFARREFFVDHRLVGDPRHDPFRRNRIGERVDAAHANRAGVGAKQAGDHPQRRGLAGAVGADQRIKLAGTHRQVETVDRGAVEALDETANLKGERRRRAEMLHLPGKLMPRGFGPVNRSSKIRDAVKALCGRFRRGRPPTAASRRRRCSARPAPASWRRR